MSLNYADVGSTAPIGVPVYALATDEHLVQACLDGDEQAWALLISRYKRLIYSFARRYGASPSDAADVFQLVCAELFRALPQLRHHDRVYAWLSTVAAHEAYRWKRERVMRAQREAADVDAAADLIATEPSPALEDAERDRLVREAIARLPNRSREVVRWLFYEEPPVPYEIVAERLGLSVGSIGVIRSRCLKKLERILEPTGYAPARVRQPATPRARRRSARSSRPR